MRDARTVEASQKPGYCHRRPAARGASGAFSRLGGSRSCARRCSRRPRPTSCWTSVTEDRGDRVGGLGGGEQRIVVALDVSTAEEAYEIASGLRHHVGVLKVGLELLMSAGAEVVRQMTPVGLPIFLDGKFHDIPTTVARASRAATRLGVSMFNVHALGGREMMRSAVEAARDEAHGRGFTRRWCWR